MRSQEEILGMISRFMKSSEDFGYVNSKILIRKLTWNNAKKYLKTKDLNEKNQKEWVKISNLERSYLYSELHEIVDSTACSIADNDLVSVFIGVQKILCYSWLLKQEKSTAKIVELVKRNTIRKDGGRSILSLVCEQFGLDHKSFVRRYPGCGIVIV